MTKIANKWPPMPLNRRETQNEEIGFSDIPQTLSGNAATLAGHVLGGESVVGVANPCPKNGSGDFGHDHSGGDMGRPFFKSICTNSFDDGSFFNMAKYNFDPTTETFGSTIFSSGNTFQNPVIIRSEPGSPGDTNLRSVERHYFSLWVPPCDLQRGAYLNCSFNLMVAFTPISNVTSNPLLAADTVDILLINNHPSIWEGVTGFELPVAGRGNVSAPYNEEIRYIESDGGLILVPGKMNPFYFELDVNIVGGAGPRACEINILDLEIGVSDSSTS